MFLQTLPKLEDLQAKRRVIEKQNLDIVGRLYNHRQEEIEHAGEGCEPAPAPVDPTHGGFVFSVGQIQA